MVPTLVVPYSTWTFDTICQASVFLGQLLYSIKLLNSPCNAIELFTTYILEKEEEQELPNLVLFIEKIDNLLENETLDNCCIPALDRILRIAILTDLLHQVPIKLRLTYRMVTIKTLHPSYQNPALPNQLPVGISLPNRHSQRYGWRQFADQHAVTAVANIKDYAFVWNERCLSVERYRAGIPMDIALRGQNMASYIGHPVECLTQEE